MTKKSFWRRGEDDAKKVSSEIIDQIKAGVAPWQKPWKPGEQISAENFSTGNKYSGGNSLYLMSRAIRDGRGDNRWGTYNQIREAGGQVRKGEKGTQVLFFTDRTAKAAKDEKGQTIKSIGPSWARLRGGTATIWFRRESVVWSGALRLRPIKLSSESRNPSVWRSGRPKTTRRVNAVRTARFEYRRWPPRRPFFGATHAAIASSLSQIVTSPRLLRPRSYSLQFRILYFFLYWRLTRLDFAATTTLPPRSL